MSLLTTILLRAVLVTMTSKTAAALNEIFLNYARDLATRTDNRIDDAVVELLRKFANLPEHLRRNAQST